METPGHFSKETSGHFSKEIDTQTNSRNGANVVIVAPNEAIAKTRALSTTDGWNQPYKDRLLEVENMLDIGKSIQREMSF
jgi:hypothetical protein